MISRCHPRNLIQKRNVPRTGRCQLRPRRLRPGQRSGGAAGSPASAWPRCVCTLCQDTSPPRPRRDSPHVPLSLWGPRALNGPWPDVPYVGSGLPWPVPRSQVPRSRASGRRLAPAQAATWLWPQAPRPCHVSDPALLRLLACPSDRRPSLLSPRPGPGGGTGLGDGQVPGQPHVAWGARAARATHGGRGGLRNGTSRCPRPGGLCPAAWPPESHQLPHPWTQGAPGRRLCSPWENIPGMWRELGGAVGLP